MFTFLSAGPGATTSPSMRCKGECSPSCQQVLELQHHPQGAVRENVHLSVSRSWSYNIILKALLGRMFTFLSAGPGATTSPSMRCKGECSPSCQQVLELQHHPQGAIREVFTFLSAGHGATTSPSRRC